MVKLEVASALTRFTHKATSMKTSLWTYGTPATVNIATATGCTQVYALTADSSAIAMEAVFTYAMKKTDSFVVLSITANNHCPPCRIRPVKVCSGQLKSVEVIQCQLKSFIQCQFQHSFAITINTIVLRTSDTNNPYDGVTITYDKLAFFLLHIHF